MPDERDIEKSLREYGQRREQEAPSAMHPATRRLLQGEVARVYGRGAPRGRAFWLGWWKQMAWVTALCVALTVIVVVGVRDRVKEEGALAKLGEEESSSPTVELSTTLEAVSADETESVRTEGEARVVVQAPEPADQGRAINLAFQAVEVAAPSETPPAAIAPEAVRPSEPRRQLERASEPKPEPSVRRYTAPATAASAPVSPPAVRTAAAPAPVAVQTAPAPAEKATLLSVQEEPVARSRLAQPALESASISRAAADRYRVLLGATAGGVYFTNELEKTDAVALPARSLADSPAQLHSPLTGFWFLQTSNGVRVVEADGSVYDGKFVVSPGASSQLVGLAAQPGQTSRVFQVIGTNHSAQQLLKIRGVAVYREALSGSVQQRGLRPEGAGQIAPTVLRIEADATLPDGKEFKIRAVPREQ